MTQYFKAMFAVNREQVMKSGYHFKNRVILKSSMDKKAILLKFVHLALLFAVITGLPSCMVRKRVAVQPNYTSFFQGQSKIDIIQKIGAPDKEFSDNKGGNVIMYDNWHRLQDKNNYFKSLDSDVKISYLRNIQYYFDEDDKCYLVSTEATDIQRKFSGGRTAGLIAGLGGFGLFLFVMFSAAAE